MAATCRRRPGSHHYAYDVCSRHSNELIHYFCKATNVCSQRRGVRGSPLYMVQVLPPYTVQVCYLHMGLRRRRCQREVQTAHGSRHYEQLVRQKRLPSNYGLRTILHMSRVRCALTDMTHLMTNTVIRQTRTLRQQQYAVSGWIHYWDASYHSWNKWYLRKTIHTWSCSTIP